MPDLKNIDKNIIDAEGGCASESELIDALSEWLSYGPKLEDEKRLAYANKCFLRLSISSENDADDYKSWLYIDR